MRKLLPIVLAALLAVPALADVKLFLDSAPNTFGSPSYDAWQNAAFAAAANGTFVNMANGINPANVGTNKFEIQDEVVYSFGDLGKRLHWIYYIEDETIDTLEGRLQISMFNTWDGDVMDFYGYYYGQTWLTPSKWVDYDADGDGITDGVIGTGGMAWWGAYGVNTQEALDADIAAWATADETWNFTVRLDNVDYSLEAVRTGIQAVPAPGAMLLAGLGAALVGHLRRRNQL